MLPSFDLSEFSSESSIAREAALPAATDSDEAWTGSCEKLIRGRNLRATIQDMSLVAISKVRIERTTEQVSAAAPDWPSSSMRAPLLSARWSHHPISCSYFLCLQDTMLVSVRDFSSTISRFQQL